MDNFAARPGSYATVNLIERAERVHLDKLPGLMAHLLKVTYDLGIKAVFFENSRNRHEFSNQSGMPDNGLESDTALERSPHHIGLFNSECVHQCRDIIRHELVAQGAVDVGSTPVKLVIDGR
jgi:hypothetical protein